MQAEHSRGNGFIISPLSAPLASGKPKKAYEKPHKVKTESNIKRLLIQAVGEVLGESSFIWKRVISMTLSVSVAVCCVMGFCNFFTIGTAIYNNGEVVAFSQTEGDYYTALSAAKSYAEEQSESGFGASFTTAPVLTLRSNISTSINLRDKLLTSSPLFASACTLYSGNTPVFNAASEEIAKKVVAEHIEAFSMNGNATADTTLTYKKTVLPKDRISGIEECSMLLSQSGKVPVISIVNTAIKKEIPFETQTEQDSSLYIGETVTVNEGKVGSAEVEAETTYKNGAQESSRILSEKIVTKPVTRVVRVGTKPKDVLKSGLLYPLMGTLSSPFGQRWGRMHEGIDIAVAEGTPVKAAECGTVTFAGDGGTYGKLVRIDHGNGVVTAYAHLSQINVSVGEAVNSETQIALSGNTGRSTGPHLHFEIVKSGTPLDPGKYLKKR